MNKKHFFLFLIPITVVLIVVIAFLVARSRVSLYASDSGTSISIIGGADGPTSVFIAGKVGDNEADCETEDSFVQIEIQIGDKTMIANLTNTTAAGELAGLLAEGEIEMSASNYGGFEKVCSLGRNLHREDAHITTKPGDIMLYNGSQIVIFYDSNTWSYTPLGHINAFADELEEFIAGPEDVVILRLAK